MRQKVSRGSDGEATRKRVESSLSRFPRCDFRRAKSLKPCCRETIRVLISSHSTLLVVGFVFSLVSVAVWLVVGVLLANWCLIFCSYFVLFLLSSCSSYCFSSDRNTCTEEKEARKGETDRQTVCFRFFLLPGPLSGFLCRVINSCSAAIQTNKGQFRWPGQVNTPDEVTAQQQGEKRRVVCECEEVRDRVEQSRKQGHGRERGGEMRTRLKNTNVKYDKRREVQKEEAEQRRK